MAKRRAIRDRPSLSAQPRGCQLAFTPPRRSVQRRRPTPRMNTDQRPGEEHAYGGLQGSLKRQASRAGLLQWIAYRCLTPRISSCPGATAGEAITVSESSLRARPVQVASF